MKRLFIHISVLMSTALDARLHKYKPDFR